MYPSSRLENLCIVSFEDTCVSRGGKREEKEGRKVAGNGGAGGCCEDQGMRRDEGWGSMYVGLHNNNNARGWVGAAASGWRVSP